MNFNYDERSISHFFEDNAGQPGLEEGAGQQETEFPELFEENKHPFADTWQDLDVRFLTQPETTDSKMKAFCNKMSACFERTNLKVRANLAHFSASIKSRGLSNLASATMKTKLLARSRNLASYDVMVTKSGQIAAEHLLEQCIALDLDAHKVKRMDVRLSLNGGMCFGICLDNAMRHLIFNESIEEIIESNQKGAREEACANQLLTQQLQCRNTIGDRIIAILENVRIMALHENFPNGPIDLGILNEWVTFANFNLLYQNPEMIDQLRPTLVGDRLRVFELLVSITEFMAVDLVYDKTKEKTFKEFLTEKISNPFHREMYRSIADQEMNYHLRLIAQLRGLDITSTIEVIGHHSFYNFSDKAYLENLHKLPAGFYCVNFDSGDVHAIVYIKLQNNSGFILDPNGVQVPCIDGGDAADKILKLFHLSVYPPADGIKGNHRIFIWKISKKKPEVLDGGEVIA